MSDHFNKLTPAQAERLAHLAEEMGEALHAIGKILRHGYESHNPDEVGPNNRGRLEKELGDIRYAIAEMCRRGDVRDYELRVHESAKVLSVRQWMHHQDDES